MTQELQDCIVREIPVYFTQNASNLCLLQFPTRPEPLANELPTSARVKKTKLELGIPLDTRTQNYSQDQANRFTVDHPLKELTLESSPVPVSACFMTGVLSDGLYLSPIAQVLQMRPLLGYIDRIDERERLAAIKTRQQDAQTDTEDEGKTYQVTTKASDANDDQKMSMYELRKQLEQEPWKDLQLFGPNDQVAIDTSAELTIAADEDTEMGNGASYIDDINQSFDQPADVKPATEPTAKMSLFQLAQLPLEKRIAGILMSAHVVDLATLSRVTDNQYSEKQIIDASLRSAFIIRGLFVVKSSLLYTGHPKHARRFLLGLFVQSAHVQLRDLIDASKISLIAAKIMIEEMAVKEPSGWALKRPADIDFQAEHVDLCKEQEELVKKEAQSALDTMNNKDVPENPAAKPAAKPVAVGKPIGKPAGKPIAAPKGRSRAKKQ